MPAESVVDIPASSAEPSSPGPPVISPQASGRLLHLTDVFSATPDGAWDEDRFDIADVSSVPGIAADVRGCNQNSATLELRLADHFKTLTMKVGQANSSPSSDDTLVVQVIANGKQQDSVRIPYNTQQPLNEAISGVNALKLNFYLDPTKCDSSGIVAVIQGLTVSG